MYNLSKYISKARCYAGFCYFMHSCLSAYDVLVANSGFCVANTALIKCFVESKVTYDRRNDCVVHQLTAFLHVPAIDVKNVVSSNHVTLFIHTQAAVCIAVVSKATSH